MQGVGEPGIVAQQGKSEKVRYAGVGHVLLPCWLRVTPVLATCYCRVGHVLEANGSLANE